MAFRYKFGGSFIEVILSISLIVIILLPIYGRTVDVFSNQELGAQYLIANGILEKQIALIKAKTKENIVTGTTNEIINELPKSSLSISISNFNIEQPAIYRVDLSLYWQGKGGTKSINTTALINLE